MPVDFAVQRRVQGRNEYRRAVARRPVSGDDVGRPPPPPRVRWLGNGPIESRGVLALCAVALLAGGEAASLAARTGGRPPGLVGPVGPGGPVRGAGRGASSAAGRPAARLHETAALARPRPGGEAVSALPVPGDEAVRAFVLWPAATLDSAMLAMRLLQSPGVRGFARAWSAVVSADPCTDVDTFVNGFWKLSHPPQRGHRSLVGEGQRAIHDGLAKRLSALAQAPPPSSPVARVLRDAWASGQRPASRAWTAFAPQAAAIAALATRQAIEAHVCAGLGDGRESILAFDTLAGMPLLLADTALLPEGERGVYVAAPADPAVVSHVRGIRSLLKRAGLPEADAAARAPAVLLMESRLAGAADDVYEVDLAAASAAVPGFPWSRIWATLGLQAGHKLFTQLELCNALEALLHVHDTGDWRAWLLYQEARRAMSFIEYPPGEAALLQRLDREDVARAALGAWYALGSDGGRGHRAQQLLDGVRGQFRHDVAFSALPAADRQRIDARLAAVRLQVVGGDANAAWQDTAADAPFLQHVHGLRRADRRAALERLGAPSDRGTSTLAAHHFMLGNDVADDAIVATPGLLDFLQQACAGRAEAEWAMLGAMLGHELGHTLANVEGLSPRARSLWAQQETAIGQRIDDIVAGGQRLDIGVVLEEVGCDLRGISAARRAGRAEAAADGQAFDDRVFFEAAARLHAANLTPAQLQAALAHAHPPAPVRAGLVRHVKGFDDAFGCAPRPTSAFDRVI